MGIDKAYYQEKLAGRGGSPHYRRIRKAIQSFRKYSPDIERFLDVGCGDGCIAVTMKKAINARKVYGIEIDESPCELARKRGIACTQMDLDKRNFPFPDNHFDAIYCGEVIEHVYYPDNLLDEIYRTLKTDGICVLDTPNLASSVNRIALLFGLQPYMTSVSERYYSVGRIIHKGGAYHQHIRVFTFRALKELLKLHNFNILETHGFTWSDNSNKRIPLPFRIAEKALFSAPTLSYNVLLVLRKLIR